MLEIIKRKRKLNFRQIFKVQNRLNSSDVMLMFHSIFYGILKTRCTTPFLNLCKYNDSNKKIRSISVYEGLVLIVVYSNVILKSLCAYMTLIFWLIYAKQINVNWMLIKNFSLRCIKLAIHVNIYYNAPRYINQSFSEYMRYIFRCILVTHFLLRFF